MKSLFKLFAAKWETILNGNGETKFAKPIARIYCTMF